MRVQTNYFNGEKFSPMSYFISKNLFPNRLCISMSSKTNSNKMFELFKEFFSDCEFKYDKYFSSSTDYFNEIYVIKEDKAKPFIIEYKHITRNLAVYSIDNSIEDTLHKISQMCYED